SHPDNPNVPVAQVPQRPQRPSQPFPTARPDDVDDIGRGGTRPPLPIFLAGQLDPSSDTAANASGSGTANAARNSARIATIRFVKKSLWLSLARRATPDRRYRVAPSR